jgi:Tol biopolymer transport system component
MPADGSGTPQILVKSDNYQLPVSWSVSGLAYLELRPSQPYEIWVLPMKSDEKPVLFLKGTYPDFSPDGKWIAYTSNESGSNEVYVQPYPGPGPKIPISTQGRCCAAWGKDGKEIFYYKPSPVEGRQRMMAVTVESSAEFKPGLPEVLFEAPFVTTGPIRGYDVSPDGQRFIVIRGIDEPPKMITEIKVIANWFEEIKRRVPIGTK